MFSDPSQKRFIIHATVSNRKSDVNNILIGAIQTDAVDFQKCQHNIYANPFVAVYEGMVGDQTVANPCTFFLFGGVKLLSAKAGKGSFQGGFQQTFVSRAHAAAGFLGNQLVQQKNLFL